MRYKMITKENMKEGDSVQFCGFYILKAKELVDSGFEPDYFFVEDEEDGSFSELPVVGGEK